MISWKSKLKVLFPSLTVEFLLMLSLGYLSTLGHPGLLKTLEEDIALAIELVMCFQLAFILFSFDYTKKQGVFQQVTYTMEQLLMLLFPKEYKKAVALDGKNVDHGI